MKTNTSIIVGGEIVNNSPKQYVIADHDTEQEKVLKIQKNPIHEVGRNGYKIEELMLIIIDQLEHYQNSEFATVENELTLLNMRNALNATRARQYERQLRDVQDTLNI